MTKADIINGTVAKRIRQVRHTLARGELKVVATLNSSYPTAGLVPVAQLAAQAGVSAPTALRLVHKLGFRGYTDFQDALREEVQMRLFSPVTVYPPADEDENNSVNESELITAANWYVDGVHATINSISADDLANAVTALAEPERKVMIVGGRFTTVLAAQLHQYLRMLRPDVVFVAPTSAEYMSSMIDVGEHTTAMLFDYRRYQRTTIEWGMAAAERGAQLVLMTDNYLSPLASHAHSVLTTSHAGPGPFDSLAHGFMITELLISLIAKKLGDPARDRLAQFEELHLAEERDRNSTLKK
ncbi:MULTISPECIES: MurR/RpiR family transcriptional regulator [Rhodococcus]|uniref:MurR/RpiR family transcriptional regulator n=1 Tax=Rhodococcus TaxID=1827 RepID=UPI001020912C|nr:MULTISPECIES: MurR/RpiR family transcriptional regulator [Rhodococcus]UTT51089.1 MurR/RpiR family transcriptional regulator [Rhodococcus gordoniae]